MTCSRGSPCDLAGWAPGVLGLLRGLLVLLQLHLRGHQQIEQVRLVQPGGLLQEGNGGEALEVLVLRELLGLSRCCGRKGPNCLRPGCTWERSNMASAGQAAGRRDLQSVPGTKRRCGSSAKSLSSATFLPMSRMRVEA